MAKDIENLRSQQGAVGGVPNNDQRNEQLKTNQAWALTEVDDNTEYYGAAATASRQTSTILRACASNAAFFLIVLRLVFVV